VWLRRRQWELRLAIGHFARRAVVTNRIVSLRRTMNRKAHRPSRDRYSNRRFCGTGRLMQNTDGRLFSENWNKTFVSRWRGVSLWVIRLDLREAQTTVLTQITVGTTIYLDEYVRIAVYELRRRRVSRTVYTLALVYNIIIITSYTCGILLYDWTISRDATYFSFTKQTSSIFTTLNR